MRPGASPKFIAARPPLLERRAALAACAPVVLVRYLRSPRGVVAALVGLVQRQMRHEVGRCGTVPVVLAGLEANGVAGSDLLRGTAATLDEAHALGHVDHLAVRMGVPRGPRAGREVHPIGPQ